MDAVMGMMWWPFRKRIKLAPKPQRYPRTVDELYRDYQHVIRIDPSHISWRELHAFEEVRRWAIQHDCGIVVDRVIWDQQTDPWVARSGRGKDQAFFGTNDEEIAMLARLRWSAA